MTKKKSDLVTAPPTKADIGEALSNLLQRVKAKHHEVYRDVERANRQIKAVEETLKEVLGPASVEIATAEPPFVGERLLPTLVYEGSAKSVVVYERSENTLSLSAPGLLRNRSAEIRCFFAPYLPALVEAAIVLMEQQQAVRLRTMRVAEQDRARRLQIPGSGLTSTADWHQPLAYATDSLVAAGCPQDLADEIAKDEDGTIAKSSDEARAAAKRYGFDLDQAIKEMGSLFAESPLGRGKDR
jgi:hypothetical protein